MEDKKKSDVNYLPWQEEDSFGNKELKVSNRKITWSKKIKNKNNNNNHA